MVLVSSMFFRSGNIVSSKMFLLVCIGQEVPYDTKPSGCIGRIRSGVNSWCRGGAEVKNAALVAEKQTRLRSLGSAMADPRFRVTWCVVCAGGEVGIEHRGVEHTRKREGS